MKQFTVVLEIQDDESGVIEDLNIAADENEDVKVTVAGHQYYATVESVKQ